MPALAVISAAFAEKECGKRNAHDYHSCNPKLNTTAIVQFQAPSMLMIFPFGMKVYWLLFRASLFMIFTHTSTVPSHNSGEFNILTPKLLITHTTPMSNWMPNSTNLQQIFQILGQRRQREETNRPRSRQPHLQHQKDKRHRPRHTTG